MDLFRDLGVVKNTFCHIHSATRLRAPFVLLDGPPLDSFYVRTAEEHANVHLPLSRRGDAASFGLLRRGAVRLASGQGRGRQEKTAKQRTDRVTVAHMFSVYETGLPNLKAEPARLSSRTGHHRILAQCAAQIPPLVSVLCISVRTTTATACPVTITTLAATFVVTAPGTELRAAHAGTQSSPSHLPPDPA